MTNTTIFLSKETFEKNLNAISLPEDLKQKILEAANISEVKEEMKPVVHAHWIYENLGYGTGRYKCSHCGKTVGESYIDDFNNSKFCCECGADMRRSSPYN